MLDNLSESDRTDPPLRLADYTLHHRAASHGSSGDWTLVTSAPTLAKAHEEMVSRACLSAQSRAHGDLMRLLGDGKDDLFVFDADVSLYRHVPEPLTVAFWEGDDADPCAMLRACGQVAQRRLVFVACACARTALHCVPPGEHRPRVAIETSERWARGEALVSEVNVARENAFLHARSSFATPYPIAFAAFAAVAAYAASYAAVYAVSAAVAAASAAAGAANATEDADSTRRRILAPIVRVEIPLSVAACAALGLRDPLSGARGHF